MQPEVWDQQLREASHGSPKLVAGQAEADLQEWWFELAVAPELTPSEGRGPSFSLCFQRCPSNQFQGLLYWPLILLRWSAAHQAPQCAKPFLVSVLGNLCLCLVPLCTAPIPPWQEWRAIAGSPTEHTVYFIHFLLVLNSATCSEFSCASKFWEKLKVKIWFCFFFFYQFWYTNLSNFVKQHLAMCVCMSNPKEMKRIFCSQGSLILYIQDRKKIFNSNISILCIY